MTGMSSAFYIAGVIAILATIKAITQVHAVRALLYLIVSFLSVAVVFFILGAPFAAALEVITYAGAIMVLFVFVVMMLNLGPESVKQERRWLEPGIWIGPAGLAVILLAEVIYVLVQVSPGEARAVPTMVSPQRVGEALLGPYALGVEFASLLLLAGLIGAFHLGRRWVAQEERGREAAQPPFPGPRLRLVSTAAARKKAGAS